MTFISLASSGECESLFYGSLHIYVLIIIINIDIMGEIVNLVKY